MSDSRPKARSILHNAGWAVVGRVSERGIGLAIALLLARRLGPELYGSVGIALAGVTLLHGVVRGGTAPRATRLVARDPDLLSSIYATQAGLRLCLLAGVLLAGAVSLPFLSNLLGIPERLVVLSGLLLVPGAVSPVWALIALERIDVQSLGLVLERGLVLVGVFFLVRDGSADWIRVPVIEFACVSVILAGYLIFLRRYGGVGWPRFEGRAWLPWLAEGAPLVLVVLARRIPIEGATLLIGAITSLGEVGLFLVAQRIVLAFNALALGVSEAAFSRVSRLVMSDRADAIQLESTIVRLTLVLLLPAALIGGLAGGPILAWVFGAQFEAGRMILALALWTLPMTAVLHAGRSLLLALGDSKAWARGSFAGIACNLIAMAIAVPMYGAAGAAVAWLAGEIVATSLVMVSVHARFGAVPLDGRIWRLAPACLAGALVFAAPITIVPAQIALCLAVYALVALGLGAVRRDELQAALAALR